MTRKTQNILFAAVLFLAVGCGSGKKRPPSKNPPTSSLGYDVKFGEVVKHKANYLRACVVRVGDQDFLLVGDLGDSRSSPGAISIYPLKKDK